MIKYDNNALSEEILREGGVLEALQYGVLSTQISDSEIALLWNISEEIFADLQDSIRDIYDALEELGITYI